MPIYYFLTDCNAKGYRKKDNVLSCDFCDYSVQRALSMVKHVEDDNPEHLRISTYDFISHFRIGYSQLD
jgi:hypothetical protein